MNLFLDKIPRIHTQDKKSETGLKISSVIFPIFKEEDSYSVLLTRRSSNLNSHAGQISFPGGKFDESDITLLNTANREWNEEMGESHSHLEFLSELEEVKTGTGYSITPFLCMYNGNFQFQINKDEVDSILKIKFKDFLNTPFYEIDFQRKLKTYSERIYYFDFEKDLLWGATCKIIYTFLKNYTDFKKKPIRVLPNMTDAPFFNPQSKFIVKE